MATPEGNSTRGSAVLDLLRSVPMFQFLGPRELVDVASGMGLGTYDAGKIIFHKDDPRTTLQIIASGSVRIFIPAESGEEAPLAILKAGDNFGELALLDGSSRTASAMAIGRTAILTLERDEFLRFVTVHPQAAAVFRALAALIRNQNEQLYSKFFEP